MSSFDTAREKWELYHMKERDKVKEAAESGRPTACFRLADLYAYFKYLGDDTMLPKIEQYCMRAFEADVLLHTKDLLYQNLLPFIKYNHPEWFEMYKIILET